MLYLYGITDWPELPLPDMLGLNEGCILGLSFEEIGAVVSPCATANVAASVANIRRHEAVVEALMTDRSVVPVRFGAILDNECAVRRIIESHYAGFLSNLGRVRGRVELGLRVLWDDAQSGAGQGQSSPHDSPASPPENGRAYLLVRLEAEQRDRAQHERATAVAMKLHAPLARLAAESTKQLLVTPRMLMTAAYLVNVDQVACFQQVVADLSTAYPALRFLCTGPWPPYNFTMGSVLSTERNNTHV